MGRPFLWAAYFRPSVQTEANECGSFAPVFRLALHCLCIRVLHFEPVGRAARTVGRVLPLRHDTLEAELAGIGQAKFTLNGQEYKLAANNGPNSLHGGLKGSRFVVFDAKQIDDATVQMSYVFKDGEESYPGTVPLRVVYSVTDDNEFVVAYDATAVDKATVVNFTTHTFFNLAGQGRGDVLGHVVTVNAGSFTPIDKTLIPTGEIRPVKGTPMDFTAPEKFGARIDQDDEQLKLGGGYDHNYVLNKRGNELSFAARVHEPTSGRVMEVWSTEPGMQLYSGNFLEGKVPRDVGKGGAVYAFRTGFCLEPQHFPDSPNKPNFPSTVLNPGDWYSGKTIYRFAAGK